MNVPIDIGSVANIVTAASALALVKLVWAMESRITRMEVILEMRIAKQKADDKQTKLPLSSILFLAALLAFAGCSVMEKKQAVQDNQTSKVIASEQYKVNQTIEPAKPATLRFSMSPGLRQFQADSNSPSALFTNRPIYDPPAFTLEVNNPPQSASMAAGGNSISDNSASTFAASLSQRLPMAVAILIASIGFLLILAGIWIIRRSSVSANAAYNAADKSLAGVIDKITSHAVSTTDPAQASAYNSLLASLEKERGKLASNAP